VATAIAIAQPAAIYWISIWAGALFAVGWLPTVVAGLEWRRMNAKAAMVSMLVGVVSFIGITELVNREMVALPLFLDPLMVAFALAVISLVVVALLTRPTEREVEYFQQMKGARASDITIRDVLSKPGGLAKLKQEYRNIYAIAIFFLVLSVVVWGYFFFNLGL
jgi:sodium/pantothenate symporter